MDETKSKDSEELEFYIRKSKELLDACREDLYECIRLQSKQSNNLRTKEKLSQEAIIDVGVVTDYTVDQKSVIEVKPPIELQNNQSELKKYEGKEHNIDKDNDSVLSEDDDPGKTKVELTIQHPEAERLGNGGIPVVPTQEFLDELFEDEDRVEFLIAEGEPKAKGPIQTIIEHDWQVKVLNPREKRELLKRQETIRLTELHRQKSEQLDKVLALKKPVFKEGYMIKVPTSLGNPFSRSKSRWFVLSGRVLVYLASNTAQVPRKMIDLAGAQVEAVKNPRGPTGFEVRLRVVVNYGFGERGLKRYRLCTESPEEAISWSVAIKNNIDYANQEEERKLNPDDEDTDEVTKILSDFSARRQSRVGIDITARSADPPKTYYDLLGVAPSATEEAIKTAYRELAMNYHPDKNKVINPSDFASISRAYSTLKDPDSRAEYDLSERVKSALRRGVVMVKYERKEKSQKEIEEDCRKTLIQVYERVNPEKVNDVDILMERYKGRESELLRLVEEKYGPIQDKDETDSYSSSRKACFLDEPYAMFIWQDEEHGHILQSGYNYVELRYVQKILAGENYPGCPKGIANRCFTLMGNRMGCDDIILELDSEDARNEMLKGLRILRSENSMLFKQNLEKMLQEGYK